MMSLGRPPVVAETLEQRIEARVREAAEMLERTGMSRSDDGGLALVGDGEVLLTLADVARIAAAEARSWF